MEVHLVFRSVLETRNSDQVVLRRSKRRWAPPDFHILENDVGPFPKDVDTLVSDTSAKFPVYYTITGEGYDTHPVGVFSLNQETGMLRVLKAVDREQFPEFTFIVRVFNKQTREETDDPLPMKVVVDDVNDNAPHFTDQLQFSVLEHSNPGTVVGEVNASDRDKEGTDHVKIKYTLESENGLFAIDGATGIITTKTNTLDREVKDKYLVIVKITDRNGSPSGLFNTGTATISLSDINDNPPTFTKTSYKVSVSENEKEKLLLRIPVEDKDLIKTPNWASKFVITKGNEHGDFRIDIDPITNEGLLYVAKPLNHEKKKNINLEITAQNQVPLSGTSAKWMSIPVDVAVTDVDEGPEFTAPIVRFTVKENTPNGTVIGLYTAVDPETKSSEGIKYYKLTDPGSWVNVDRDTGELRVANTIDRESSLVEDGIYNITVKAADSSTKTAVGTVILQVDDANDNMPKVPEQLRMCDGDGDLASVVVVAEDKDAPPNSAPFTFSLPPNHDGKWSLTRYNDTAATLKQTEELHTGIYEVPMMVTDLQGIGKLQTAKVRICYCVDGDCPAAERNISFGPLGLLALLLPLLLLLLLFLAFIFFCMTRRDKVEMEDFTDGGGILLKSNTEAPGDEVDSSLITVPSVAVDQAVKGSVKGVNAGWQGDKNTGTIKTNGAIDDRFYNTGITTSNTHEFYSGQYGSQFEVPFGSHLIGSGVGTGSLYRNQDFLRIWHTNGICLQQKMAYMGTEDEDRYADDIIHAYGFEGRGSTAGSVGCCSDYDERDNLDFLNTLGPKFKTLASVCRKT
ncbi:desmocollin 2-like protein [Pholidichthys leucotaenia]